MDTSTPVGDPESATTSVVVERRLVRRHRGRRFWSAAVLLPAALTAALVLTGVDGIEEALRDDARAALRAEGIKGVGLVVDGRQVTAKVPTGRDPAAVAKVLAGVGGVSGVSTESVYASKAEARACQDIQDKLDRATGGQKIPFVGESATLSSSGVKMLGKVAVLLKACRAPDVVIGGHSDPSTPKGSTLSLERARVMIRVLKGAGVAGDRLTARGYGDQFPVTDGPTPAEQARNERGSVMVEGQ